MRYSYSLSGNSELGDNSKYSLVRQSNSQSSAPLVHEKVSQPLPRSDPTTDDLKSRVELAVGT